jgi:hypothetical protein
MRLAPDEGVHAAHRGAEDQSQLLHPQLFGEHPVLRADHVVIVVFRELHAHPVAGLRRAAVAEVVGQDHIIFARIEKLAGAEELVRELRLEELLSRAAGAVKDHHGVGNIALLVALRRAERRVVHLDFGQLFAGAKGKILEDRIALDGAFDRLGVSVNGAGEQQGEWGEELVHGGTLACLGAHGKSCLGHRDHMRCAQLHRHPGLDPGSRLSQSLSGIPDQVRDDEGEGDDVRSYLKAVIGSPGNLRPTARNPAFRRAAPPRARRRRVRRPWPRTRAVRRRGRCRRRCPRRPGRASRRPSRSRF